MHWETLVKRIKKRPLAFAALSLCVLATAVALQGRIFRGAANMGMHLSGIICADVQRRSQRIFLPAISFAQEGDAGLASLAIKAVNPFLVYGRDEAQELNSIKRGVQGETGTEGAYYDLMQYSRRPAETSPAEISPGSGQEGVAGRNYDTNPSGADREDGASGQNGVALRNSYTSPEATDMLTEQPDQSDIGGGSGDFTYEQLMLSEYDDIAAVTKEDLARENMRLRISTYADFIPHAKAAELPKTDYSTYDALLKNFYTVDPTTMAGSNELDAERFLSMDFRIEQSRDQDPGLVLNQSVFQDADWNDDPGDVPDTGLGVDRNDDQSISRPQILIYHTHSQEAYADSVLGDPSTTVVGVGERLAMILEEQYGYKVLHDTGEYDKPSRDQAYSKALPRLQEILKEHPSIEVVIDLHRDEMPGNTRLVTKIDGKDTARFMFFNGLSRTKQTGNLDYLKNENLESNLAFSFQLEKKAMEYYPNLTRKIYLKGYRYNMHLLPRTILVEMGAQNNTLEEAMNACGPLAHILDLVLRGDT